jgi:hypothetical protein
MFLLLLRKEEAIIFLRIFTYLLPMVFFLMVSCEMKVDGQGKNQKEEEISCQELYYRYLTAADSETRQNYYRKIIEKKCGYFK